MHAQTKDKVDVSDVDAALEQREKNSLPNTNGIITENEYKATNLKSAMLPLKEYEVQSVEIDLDGALELV